MRDLIDQEAETALDIAELKLLEFVEAGAPWALKFFLRLKGKHRAYSERFEVVNTTDTPPEIIIPRNIDDTP